MGKVGIVSESLVSSKIVKLGDLYDPDGNFKKIVKNADETLYNAFLKSQNQSLSNLQKNA